MTEFFISVVSVSSTISALPNPCDDQILAYAELLAREHGWECKFIHKIRKPDPEDLHQPVHTP
jgi:hypothetical protein